jgi:small-conductance mechanosensitive channel
MTRLLRSWLLVLVLAALAWPALALSGAAGAEVPDVEVPSSPVEVDGRVLFSVRGSASYPAEKRAAAIAERISAVARDRSLDPRAIAVGEVDGIPAVMAGGRRIVAVFAADAEHESMTQRELAAAYLTAIREGITAYREERSSEAVLHGLSRAASATGVLAAALLVLWWLRRRIDRALEKHVKGRVHSVGISSFEIVRAERLWGLVRGLLRTAQILAALTALYLFLSYVLNLFPGSRGIANRLAGWVIGPVKTMAEAVLGVVPNLIFIAILYVIVRWLLRTLRMLFEGVGEGRIALGSFEREWAEPTYKLTRIAVVAFALVVAYPYIPGSQSAAFKGVSLFAGIVFSLGSSTAIANVIAGYSLTYRRAFKVGDRVKIGDVVGEVTAVRLQVTHLRTVKNEEEVVPNSTILSSAVTNYTTLARSHGLLLHTTVGIGYETPWRQVEAMLLLAAGRTPGLLAKPEPFVLQRALGDFCVTYELNAATDTPQRMLALYDLLHRNILDVFNEYNVQIMTPAYEGDPETPKVVPKEQWHLAPAAAQVAEVTTGEERG